MKGTANSHYPTLSLQQLKQLKIQEITADDCILLMWTTGPQLENALELMQSWGFHYNTLFMTWVKTSNNGQVGRGARLGFYTRQTVEMVLMGTRGHVHKYKKPRGEMLYNILLEDPEEHSRKPSRVKKVIDQMFLDVPRIELFARIVNKKEDLLHWDHWGNEVSLLPSASIIMDNKVNEEEVDKIRSTQIQLAQELSQCKKNNNKGKIMVDKGNRYGLQRNRQKSLLSFFSQKYMEEGSVENKEEKQ